MKTYLDPKDIELIENSATNLRDKLLIRLLFHLGCRVSEALGLSPEDVDFDRSMVSIQHLKMRLRLSCAKCGARLSGSHIFCPKCGDRVADAVAKELEHRRQRTIPVDKETLAMLKEYITRGGAVERHGKTLILGINRHRAWQIVSGCAKRAGLLGLVNPDTGKIHNISPQRLRDAFAVHAVRTDDSGDGLRLLQQHLGHASFNTTARYRKVSGEEQRIWYARLWQKEKT